MGASTLTPLAVALVNVNALGLDTPPFVYFMERHPTYLNRMRAIFRRVRAGTVIAYTSAITIAEILTKPYQTQNLALANRYQRMLLRGRNFSVLTIDVQTALTAADLRARYNLRTADALQIAAAVEAGCDAFLTNDHALRRVTEIPILFLDELTL